MCELYLSSSDAPHFPKTELAQLQRHGGAPWTNLQGWGAAWLQGEGDTDGFGLEKYPQPARGTAGYDGLLYRAYQSPVWLVHLRAASSGGVSRENTQPYRFAWPEEPGPDASDPPTTPRAEPHRAGVYMHNGELKGMTAKLIETYGQDPRDGNADSEGGAILLRDALARVDTADAAWSTFRNWAQEMRTMGIANFIVALGRDAFVHVHRRTELGEEIADDTGLYLAQSDSRLRLSSEPFSNDDEPLARGTLLWIRGSEVRARGLTQ